MPENTREHRSEILIFTACFNERDNIGPLIDQIVASVPGADILVVDDNSPDGTFEIVRQRAARYQNLYSQRRPRKLGIGSAHKYSILYAIREGYKTLVTLDADFSHDPKVIPKLLAAHGSNIFVTGSRYCEGGKSDYTGYRNIVSRLGNAVARAVLGVRIREITTYFRVFDTDNLRRLPLRRISASGYSFGVELIYYLRKLGVELREVPIHFTDRTHGRSKIPRMQILYSALDLVGLGLRRWYFLRDLEPDKLIRDPCGNCGDRVLAMKHAGYPPEREADVISPDVAAYQCTAVGRRSYPPVYTCLNCGLEQIPGSLVPNSLERLYEEVVDLAYLENNAAKEKTFRRCFSTIERFAGAKGGQLLEVGAYCGVFLREAGKRGWQTDGVEPSTWASRYARDVLGQNVYQGFLDTNRSNLREQYDVIVAWDVIEHVRQPREFVVECGTFLKKGGLLCFSTLDVDSWLPRLLGKRWPWLMDMHLYYFSCTSVADLLDRVGFDLIHATAYVHFARIRYAVIGLAGILPRVLQGPIRAFAGVIPRRLVLPIALGDIKLYVARKR